MTTRYEFIDGFDGWSGMGAYTSTGANESHSPWQLFDLTSDIAFDPGAVDYSDMVSPTGGVYGGGALRIPQRDLGLIGPRYESANYLSWFPYDDYVLNGQNISPTVPYSLTWGYWFKTEADGFNGLNPACGVELFRWRPTSYRANNSDVMIDAINYAAWMTIKRPDNVLWTGWAKTSLSEGTVDEQGAVAAAQPLSGWGDKFYFIFTGGKQIKEGTWPTVGFNGTTYDIASDLLIVLPGPVVVGFDAYDLCHDFVGNHYVLSASTGGDIRVFEFDLTWTATGNSWDITADSAGCNTICYIQDDDTFLVGANTTDGRTLVKYDRSFNFVSSSLASLVAGSSITALAAIPSAPDEYWMVYLNGTSGRTEVVEPNSAIGVIPTAEAGYDIGGIYDDGFFCWVLGGVEPLVSEGSRGHRHFYRGEVLSNVGFFESGTGGAPGETPRSAAVTLDWGESYFLEHAYRAVVTPTPGVDVGIATTRVDEVKMPIGVADATATADFDFASKPVTLTGNAERLTLYSLETHLKLTGDVAFIDDFYLKSNDTLPTEDPEDYDGPIRIHTVRPTRVSGTLAPVGDFSIFGWKETVTQAKALNDNTSYLVAQQDGDSSRLYFGDIPTINGTIGCVVPMMSYCREELDLTTSTYPVSEHSTYAQMGITSSLTEGGLVDIPQPDPTNTDLSGKFSVANPYNIHLSAACDMYGMTIGYTISETDPLTGATWNQALINNMKMHIKAADPTPFYDWPWTNRDGV